MFEYNPAPKPQHKRKQPKRANRTAFSARTMEYIRERDNGLCVRCGKRGIHVHHILFRSSLAEGVNDASNGCLVCIECHNLAHTRRDVREWFEQYREKCLMRGV